MCLPVRRVGACPSLCPGCAYPYLNTIATVGCCYGNGMFIEVPDACRRIIPAIVANPKSHTN
jgi:hypothetical protein